MNKIHFTCLSSNPSRGLLVLLVASMLAMTTLSMARTWDRKCINNDSFDTNTFVESANPQKINGNLIEAVVHRGSIIPSMIKMTIDSTVGTYNHSVDYCPWSDPMPLAARKVPSDLSRDVCYTMKVGSHQIQNAFVLDINDPDKVEENQRLREENLEEIVSEIKEFNFGNCAADMNHLLFANYEQMLFTVTEYKYSLSDFSKKINLVTPQNFYFLREKLHGTVRDVVNKKLHFKHEEDKTWHDVILFQMARSVNMLHLRGWVHRDIKNENFFVKKTVDERIEVRLGEFLGSRMTSTHQRKETDIDDETYGGPFYIPIDARDHPDDIGNDYFALGLSMIELITHRNVEENIVQAKPQVNLATLDHSEVLVQDKVETKMELDFDPLFEGIELDNVKKSQEIVEERKEQILVEQKKTTNQEMDLDFSLDSTNLFEINSLDMNFVSLVTPEKKSSSQNYRVLEQSHTRNLSDHGRILPKTNYGDIDLETFNIDSGQYGELNFDPHADQKVNTFVNESLEEVSDLMVHEEFQINNKNISLPSVNNSQLNDNFLVLEEAIETKVVNSSLNVFHDEEIKPAQQVSSTNSYNAQKEADALIKRMSGNSYYDRFINLKIFGESSDPEFAKAKQSNVNAQAMQYCYKEFNDYRASGSQHVSNFTSYPTTTECLMIFIARSILQSDNYKQGGYNYFRLLDAGYNMESMTDVFDMIALDRKITKEASQTMVSFDDYYHLYNRILI